MPEDLFSDWLLWAGPEALRVLRRQSWRSGAPYIEQPPVATADDSAAALVAACREACARIARRAPLRITLALPQSRTPALSVEFAADRLPPSVREAYLRARFEQVFGAAARSWRVQCDARVQQGRCVAFACDAELIQGLLSLRAGVVRLSVMPAVVWGAGRTWQALRGPRRQAAEQPALRGWYVQREPDRDVALRLGDERVSDIALLPAAAAEEGLAPLATRLDAWAGRLRLPADVGASLLVAMPDAQPREWVGTAPAQALRIGLFGDLGARPAA